MSEENSTSGSMNPNPEASAPAAAAQPILRRSKFPRATPILTSHSTGIARIRRLSGHFSNNDSETATCSGSTANSLNVEIAVRSTPPSTPLIHYQHHHLQQQQQQHQMSPLVIHNENSNGSQHSMPAFTRLQSIIKSPGSSHAVSPLISKLNLTNGSHDSPDHYLINSNPSTPIPQSSMSFRQYLTAAAASASSNMSGGFNSVPMSPVTTHILQQQPTTPGGSIYNPKFSAEHIMNIIKYKALQKLKKIESDSLKEKRKKNQLKQLKGDDAAPTDSAASANPAVLDRSKIRMRDLLYYNVKSNSSNKKTVSPTDPDEVIIEDGNVVLNDEIILHEANSFDINDESLGGASADRSLSNDSLSSEVYPKDSNQAPPPQPPAPPPPPPAIASQSAPQLKFAEDGSIIINEESLFIQRIEVEPQYDSTVVEESENLDNLNYNSYRKFHHTKKWTKRETAKFYKALSMIGTDFTMIQRLFSHRNRDEIKRKFKREEKLNQALIDKILSTTTKIDLSVFVSASSEDEAPPQATADDTTETNTQETSANTIDPTKKVIKKKTKPRRIKKRAFIESDDEDPSIAQHAATTSADTSAHDTNGEEFPFKKKQSKRRLAKKFESVAATTTQKDATLSLLTAVHESIVGKIQENKQKEEKEKAEAASSKKVVVEEEEEENDEDDIVLDLDTNQITSNNSVLMNIYYQQEENKNKIENEKEENEEVDEQEGEEIILDLDNNKIITNNNKTILNVNYEQNTSVPLASSHSETTAKATCLTETTFNSSTSMPNITSATTTISTPTKSQITITRIPRT